MNTRELFGWWRCLLFWLVFGFSLVFSFCLIPWVLAVVFFEKGGKGGGVWSRSLPLAALTGVWGLGRRRKSWEMGGL